MLWGWSNNYENIYLASQSLERDAFQVKLVSYEQFWFKKKGETNMLFAFESLKTDGSNKLFFGSIGEL